MEFAVFGFMRHCKRMWDQHSFNIGNLKESRSATIEEFLSHYLGPNFEVHYKFSFIMYVYFITFMYGAVLPALFPIALFNLIIFWLTERL
jgi:hypothetical protein